MWNWPERLPRALKKAAALRVKFLIFIFLNMLLIGCDSSDPKAEPSRNALSVSKTHINEGQAFRLFLPENHPKEFGIETPEGDWFFIHGESYGLEFWPYETKIKAKDILLDPTSLTGMKWVNGVKITTPVFTSKGVYKIYLADNLETEAENTYSLSVDVTYK